LHAVASDGAAALADVPAVLRRAGFPLERIGRIAPSLEDVFVSLIESHDRSQSPQREVRQ
jgi:ABC-2 type transport system ATP-binding protein